MEWSVTRKFMEMYYRDASQRYGNGYDIYDFSLQENIFILLNLLYDTGSYSNLVHLTAVTQ